ncbi:MAG: NAD-dependent deacylase [Deltaproteobacteria bacterium]|nr:NAD-dependent deacylase [Deltaproteobacteria bacterium]
MEEQDPRASIDAIAALVAGASHVVAFTGAGVSTESGIPDFRSPGGIWEKFNPADFTFDKYCVNPEVRKLTWLRYRMMKLSDIEPNAAHYALAQMERMGKLDCVITQNIDGLHLKAGNSAERIIELHGTARLVRCLDCGKEWPFEEIAGWFERGIEDPHCDECGGILKAATISFGQAMPVEEMARAERHSRGCDLFIVIGSSLVVYPAAYMPVYALEGGAPLVIINRDETPMDHLAAVVVRESAGKTMAGVMARIGPDGERTVASEETAE